MNDKAKHAAYMKLWRAKNPDKAREHVRKSRTANLERYRKQCQAGVARWRSRHKDRWNALKIVRAWVKRGKLTKTPYCQVCLQDGPNIQCHHYLGYGLDVRTEVVWLCRPCHMEAEGKYNVWKRVAA